MVLEKDWKEVKEVLELLDDNNSYTLNDLKDKLAQNSQESELQRIVGNLLISLDQEKCYTKKDLVTKFISLNSKLPNNDLKSKSVGEQNESKHESHRQKRKRKLQEYDNNLFICVCHIKKNNTNCQRPNIFKKNMLNLRSLEKCREVLNDEDTPLIYCGKHSKWVGKREMVIDKTAYNNLMKAFKDLYKKLDVIKVKKVKKQKTSDQSKVLKERVDYILDNACSKNPKHCIGKKPLKVIESFGKYIWYDNKKKFGLMKVGDCVLYEDDIVGFKLINPTKKSKCKEYLKEVHKKLGKEEKSLINIGELDLNHNYYKIFEPLVKTFDIY